MPLKVHQLWDLVEYTKHHSPILKILEPALKNTCTLPRKTFLIPINCRFEVLSTPLMISITLTATGRTNPFWQADITSLTPITNPSDEEPSFSSSLIEGWMSGVTQLHHNS
jgi:hypothetical protein